MPPSSSCRALRLLVHSRRAARRKALRLIRAAAGHRGTFARPVADDRWAVRVPADRAGGRASTRALFPTRRLASTDAARRQSPPAESAAPAAAALLPPPARYTVSGPLE